jgi:hypothetical protein
MKNLKPSELFSKGYIAMKNNDYLKAEQYFLVALYQLSIKQDDYVSLLGCLDKLSLHLYPKGNFENRDRVLEFYKLLSRVDINVSQGYARALINGVLGEPDYTEAIKQISKGYDDEKIYLLAYLMNEGKGLEKDSSKAAILLKSQLLVSSDREEEAKKLYDSIGIDVLLNDEQIEENIYKILKEIFKNSTSIIEEDSINIETMLIEFFKNTKNIPEIDK